MMTWRSVAGSESIACLSVDVFWEHIFHSSLHTIRLVQTRIGLAGSVCLCCDSSVAQTVFFCVWGNSAVFSAMNPWMQSADEPNRDLSLSLSLAVLNNRGGIYLHWRHCRFEVSAVWLGWFQDRGVGGVIRKHKSAFQSHITLLKEKTAHIARLFFFSNVCILFVCVHKYHTAKNNNYNNNNK